MTDKKINLGLRLSSMLVDHAVMSFTIVPPLIVLKLFIMLFGTAREFGPSPVETVAFYFVMLVYLNKDFVNARSFAKRVLGFKVIDRSTGQPASELKCFLRNLTIPFWPVEVLVSLFSKSRRLGDLIANTKLEIADKVSPGTIFTELKSKRLTVNTFWTLLIGAGYMAGLWYSMDRIMPLIFFPPQK